MGDTVGKFGVGSAYGPILSQTDLYLLKCELEVHPILKDSSADFHLVFNIATGTTGGWIDERDRELPFSQKEEPATIPRVSTLILITSLTPWCTIVRNDKGVTLGNICETLYKEYSENVITEAELASLPHRVQEMVKRTAIANAQAAQGWQSVYYQPQVPTSRLPRYNWLRDRVYLDHMKKDDRYAQDRLGFHAPNIFVLEMSS